MNNEIFTVSERPQRKRLSVFSIAAVSGSFILNLLIIIYAVLTSAVL
ncbi:MAG: hypothetical protein ACI3XQ_04810 [Eubacteriales bacterium]